MTTAEIFQREVDEITQRTGRYIPPYRMSNLMKTAHKITELLTKSDVCMTYDESMIVLRIATNAIKEVTGNTEE